MPGKHSHIYPPEDLELSRTLHDDMHRLEEVDVPIVTISATFRREIAEHLGERPKTGLEEAIFSRAHFSMAIAVFEQATQQGLSAWLVDPTNYVTREDWKRILLTERIAETVARSPFLKRIKDFVDTFARSKLPIESAVKEPLEYVVYRTKRPIVSMHYESGNLLARQGKRVLQVVTDPHVRVNYLLEAERANITFAVFDRQTKKEFLKKAHEMGKSIDEGRVVITGPPVDPRIARVREGKRATSYRKRPLRLAITTGGLGTNKQEIKKILKTVLPKVKEGKYALFLYAGTHPDFKELFVEELARYEIRPGRVDDINAAVRTFYHPSIVETNKALIDYAFGWADGFVTKPSGDMAYDAVAAGCFILSLKPWGEWEENIEKIFADLGILQKAKPGLFAKQLDELLESGWIKEAIENALGIDKLFLQGSKRIVDLQQKLAVE